MPNFLEDRLTERKAERDRLTAQRDQISEALRLRGVEIETFFNNRVNNLITCDLEDRTTLILTVNGDDFLRVTGIDLNIYTCQITGGALHEGLDQAELADVLLDNVPR